MHTATKHTKFKLKKLKYHFKIKGLIYQQADGRAMAALPLAHTGGSFSAR